MVSVEGPKAYSAIDVGWNPPTKGWIKLNIDGASKGNPSPVGCGGIFCDKEKQWLRGFICNLGICGSFTVKLWGAFYRLKLAWNLGFKYVILESDFNLLVDILKKCYFEHLEN